MKTFVKFGTVLAGYAVAVLAANAAVAVRIASTSGPDTQESAGMYACGDGLLFVAVFSAVALVPTGLALWFLRSCRWFWVVLSITAVTIAVTAILAASVYAVAGCLTLPRESPLLVWAALAVLRMLAAPPLAGAFVVAGFFAPGRASRCSLLAAAGIEGAVAGYAVLHWVAGCCYQSRKTKLWQGGSSWSLMARSQCGARPMPGKLRRSERTESQGACRFKGLPWRS